MVRNPDMDLVVTVDGMHARLASVHVGQVTRVRVVRMP
jgi:hypothetical protein